MRKFFSITLTIVSLTMFAQIDNASGNILKTVKNIKFSKTKELNLSDLSSGIYFLKVESQSIQEVKKLIIN